MKKIEDCPLKNQADGQPTYNPPYLVFSKHYICLTSAEGFWVSKTTFSRLTFEFLNWNKNS